MISKGQIFILVLAFLLLVSSLTIPLSIADTNPPTPNPIPVSAPTMLWQFSPNNYVGPGNYSVGVWSTPTIVDGIVYVEMCGQRSYQKEVPHHYLPKNETITMRDGWGGVYALNAITGELVWFVTTNGGSVLSPSVGDGKVFAQIGERKISAFNISNGQSLWNFTTKANTSEYIDMSVTVAAVSDGAVFVGGNNGKVYALNAADGSTLWGFSSDASPTLSTHYSTPTVVEGVVYVCSDRGALYALNASSGYILWSRETNTSIPMVPIVVDGVVLCFSSYDPYLHALNAGNGNEIWNFTTGTIFTAPAASNRVIYVNTGLWEKGDTIIRNNVYALNSTNGAILWNSTLGGFSDGSPSIVDGVVYIGSSDHNLYALNAGTGQLIWNYTVGAEIFPSPAISNGVICFSSTDGILHSLIAPALALSPSSSPANSTKFENQLFVVAVVALAFAIVVSLLFFNKLRTTKNR